MKINPPPWFSRNKERPRFYLFAGMGGTAARRKHRKILAWSIIAGIVVAGTLALAMIFLNRAVK